MPHDAIPRYFTARDLFIPASRSDGIPSVITDGVNGLLFEAENMRGLIGCIVYLDDDPQVHRELVRQGLSRAREEFDWSGILAAHCQVFNRLRRTGWFVVRCAIDIPSLFHDFRGISLCPRWFGGKSAE